MLWSKDAAEARRMVAAYPGVAVAQSYDALIDGVDAIAFAVPPGVQAVLAPPAAAAGKHVLLEKPLAFDLDDARRIVAAVDEAGVVSQLMLTNRFRPRVAAGLDEACAARAYAGQATVVNGGSAPGGTFATPWRIEHGALLDVGPHVFDLLETVLGPIQDMTALGDSGRFVVLSMRHRGGAISQASLSITAPGETEAARFAFWGSGGIVAIRGGRDPDETPTQRAVMASFLGAIERGRSPELDAHRGLHLQELIARAMSVLS
jgi:predicted dehydrogenase